jgi:hypothetical protein
MKNIFLMLFFLVSNICYPQKSILDKDFSNNEASIEMAVFIINMQSNSLNQSLTQDVSDILKNNKGFNTNPSFFNTDFITDGSFEKLFNAEKFNIKKLHLKDNLDYICLGKYKINSITNSEYNIFVADVSLQINIIDAKSAVIKDTRTYTVRGSGITKNDAEINARYKLCQLLK